MSVKTSETLERFSLIQKVSYPSDHGEVWANLSSLPHLLDVFLFTFTISAPTRAYSSLPDFAEQQPFLNKTDLINYVLVAQGSWRFQKNKSLSDIRTSTKKPMHR